MVRFHQGSGSFFPVRGRSPSIEDRGRVNRIAGRAEVRGRCSRSSAEIKTKRSSRQKLANMYVVLGLGLGLLGAWAPGLLGLYRSQLSWPVH
jgi:hypothetical protein